MSDINVLEIFKEFCESKRRKRRRMVNDVIINSVVGAFEELEEPMERNTRTCVPRIPPEISHWSQTYLMDPTYRDPAHRNGKLFRLRFRLPFPVFQSILALCMSHEEFNKTSADVCGRPSAPLELLILGALRILGRGITFDGLTEGTNISQETHRLFFHKFCKFMSEKQFDRFCKPPETDAEIKSIAA